MFSSAVISAKHVINSVVCVVFQCNKHDVTSGVCLHGLLPAPFLLSYSVFDFIFSLFFISGPRARLSWPSRQLLSARQSAVSYRIVTIFVCSLQKSVNLSM